MHTLSSKPAIPEHDTASTRSIGGGSDSAGDGATVPSSPAASEDSASDAQPPAGNRLAEPFDLEMPFIGNGRQHADSSTGEAAVLCGPCMLKAQVQERFDTCFSKERILPCPPLLNAAHAQTFQQPSGGDAKHSQQQSAAEGAEAPSDKGSPAEEEAEDAVWVEHEDADYAAEQAHAEASRSAGRGSRAHGSVDGRRGVGILGLADDLDAVGLVRQQQQMLPSKFHYVAVNITSSVSGLRQVL